MDDTNEMTLRCLTFNGIYFFLFHVGPGVVFTVKIRAVIVALKRSKKQKKALFLCCMSVLSLSGLSFKALSNC